MVERYVVPHVGAIALRQLVPRDLTRLYTRLQVCGGANGRALADKTVHEVHVLIRSCLREAHVRELIPTNPALTAAGPSAVTGRVVPQRWWNAGELRDFLHSPPTPALLNCPLFPSAPRCLPWCWYMVGTWLVHGTDDVEPEEVGAIHPRITSPRDSR
jgi:hypothetical protein